MLHFFFSGIHYLLNFLLLFSLFDCYLDGFVLSLSMRFICLTFSLGFKITKCKTLQFVVKPDDI